MFWVLFVCFSQSEKCDLKLIFLSFLAYLPSRTVCMIFLALSILYQFWPLTSIFWLLERISLSDLYECKLKWEKGRWLRGKMTGKGKNVFLDLGFVTSVQFAVSHCFCVCVWFSSPLPLTIRCGNNWVYFYGQQLENVPLCSFISVL